MPDNIYLGLDNTQPNMLRAVYVLTERPFTTSVIKWERCKDLLQFQQLIKHFIPSMVAISTIRHDPYGAITWLCERQTPMQRFSAHEFTAPFDEDDELQLPKSYRRAHSLAYQAAYEFEAPRALEALWRDMQLAKLTLDQMELDFNRLQSLHSIPF